MKIAVNTRLLIDNKLDGIGWFTYESLKRITTSYKNHEFIFIFDRPYSNKFIFSENITPVVIGPQTRHPFLWYFWFEKCIPKILKKYNADIFLSPDGYLSLSTSIPSIAIIHDINFHHQPEDLPFFTRKYYQYYFPKFAQKAIRIGTVSNYSKNDIVNSYNIKKDKIDVLYNGANCYYKPISENEKRKIKRNFTNGYNYFVFVGNLHPRKNVTRLLQAFDLFKKETNSEMKMVIVGDKFFKTKEISNTYKKMKNKNDVIFTGRQSPNNLRLLIGGATALTFVPTFEGFGIPNLEAMYCDIPVITSNSTAIPEVVHDAGILVDPYWVAEIKEAMVKISTDFDFRNKLIEKGQKRRTLYSWDNTAENLWKCIEKCI